MKTPFLMIGTLLLSLAASGCDTAPRPSPDTPGLDPEERALQAFELTAPEAVRASYDALGTSEKASLWRAQMRRSLGRAGLTAEQRRVIGELSDRAEDYLKSGIPEADARRFESAFTDIEKGQIFERLGAVKPSTGKGGDSHSFMAWTCTTRWCSCCTCCLPPCPEPQPTWTCSEGCAATSNGCGFLWLQSCTKDCFYDDPPN